MTASENYLDARGNRVKAGDHVHVHGWDPNEFRFEVKSLWFPSSAVIRNLAPGFDRTSTVPTSSLYPAEPLPAAGDTTDHAEEANR